MRVSIGLATYQGARFLSQQLESYLGQSRRPDELCVSDDGSSDETLKIVQDYAAKVPFPVKVVTNSNRGGANKNFENVVQHCSGDVILFSDQDDVWLPTHIQRLVVPMESDSRIMAVASNSLYVNENLELTGTDLKGSERFSDRLRNATMRLPPNQFELVVRHRISAGHGLAFRSSTLPLLIPFPDDWVYDQWVFLLCAAAGYVTYVPEELTLHRQHSRQAIGNRREALKDLTAGARDRKESNERFDQDKWGRLLARVQERPVFVREPESVELTLQEKVNHIIRRARIRRASLPLRTVLTFRDLILGRYHRRGRGLYSFASDLYGTRR